MSEALDHGSSRDGREFAQESRLQPPQHPRVAREWMPARRFGLYSASLESGVLVSLTLKEVSDLREGIRFSVLFPHQREADLQQDGLR